MAQNNLYRSNGAAAYDIYKSNTALPLEKPAQLPRSPIRRKPVQKVKVKMAVSPFAIVGTMVALVMLFLVLFSYVRLYETKSESSDLQQELNELNTQYTRLHSQYEETLDLQEIEVRATELGMGKPGASQIVYIQAGTDDVAEVYTAPQESNIFVQVYDAFRDVFTDALAYFS
ncbi:MAG: hypothetical protein LBM28_04075 [Oscillospiraceae bacterium]|jgi:cell division protein FtsL|nr:hypothetical protein [Oscillospiraceae bacterium]